VPTKSETTYYSADHCFGQALAALIQRLPNLFFVPWRLRLRISKADQNKLISGQIKKG
jgi:hypothetical protein